MITIFQNDKGRSPSWLTAYSSAVFRAVWKSYDVFFRPMFGDGERTVEDDDVFPDENGNEGGIGNGNGNRDTAVFGNGVVKNSGSGSGNGTVDGALGVGEQEHKGGL